MIIYCDFDNTVVSQGRSYADVETPLTFIPGAREGLLSLKRAGHKLVLWSARLSRTLLVDPTLDPLVAAGVARVRRADWEKALPVHRARAMQMLKFVEAELPGVFDAIDTGEQGKPAHCDLFLDDRALRVGPGAVGSTWREIMLSYGDPVYQTEAERKQLPEGSAVTSRREGTNGKTKVDPRRAAR